MNKEQVIAVSMNGKAVGRLALTEDWTCAFEYDADFIANGFSISPYFLPLRPGLVMARMTPFDGNFGVFDDSLPDGWGRLLLDRYLRSKGIDPAKLTILQQLSLVGSKGRGALEYFPDKSTLSQDAMLDLDAIARESQDILDEKQSDEKSIEELYAYGGSSGGARPKVFCRINGKEWLVKFKASSDPKDIGKSEYDYSLLAKECGITMPNTTLFGGKYFATERFDRIDGGKIHTISMAGLLNADYRVPCLDYSTLLKVCLNLTKDMEQVIQMFRRMVFNVLISNRDDHAKNFAMQMKDGRWQLSPAYDLLPSSGFNGYHTTTINGSGEPTLTDVVSVGTEVGICEDKAITIVEELTKICNSANMHKRRFL